MDNSNRNVNFDLTAQDGISPQIDRATASLAAARDMAVQLQAALGGISGVNLSNLSGLRTATRGTRAAGGAGTAGGGSGAGTRSRSRNGWTDDDIELQKQMKVRSTLLKTQERQRVAEERELQKQQALSYKNSTAGKFRAIDKKISNFGVGIIEYQALQGATAAVQGFFDEIDRSVQAAAQMDRFSRSFNNLLGDQGSAALAQTKQFARGTPFDLQESITLAQRFVAVGFQWSSVIPTMDAAANSIARLGKGTPELDRTVLALTQIQTRGHLAGNEIKQLSEVGIDALSILASTTGKTTAELQDMVTAGQISAATFLDSFRKWDAANGDFLTAQANDYLGIQQNLEDVTFELEAAFGQQAMERRKQATKGLLDLLQNPAVKGFVSATGGFGGILAGNSDDLQKTMLQGFIHATYLNLKLLGQNVGTFEQYLTALAQSQAAVTQATDDNTAAVERAVAAAQKERDGIQARIDALTKQNDLLKQASALEDELAGIGEAQFNLNRDRRLSLSVYTSEGRSAADRVQSDQETLAKRLRDYAVNSQINANTAEIKILTANLDIADARLSAAQNGAIPPTPGGYSTSSQYLANLGTPNAGMTNHLLTGGSISPSAPGWNYWLGGQSFDQLGQGQVVGHRASGGPVHPGWFTVGEHGPEMLHAGGSGTVVPHGGAQLVGYCPGCQTNFLVDQLANNPRVARASGQGQSRFK